MRQTRESYETRARELKNLALVLGDREDDPTAAVDQLLDATGPDVLALRRAHRQCEREIRDDWPADQALIRAFFYLSAARTRAESSKQDEARPPSEPN